MARTLAEAAAEARGHFGRIQHPGRDAIWATKDGAPEWARELAISAHGDMGPDDVRYGIIVGCLDAIAEGNDPDEWEPDTDVYTSGLTGWLASHIDRCAYVDEARETHDLPAEMGIFDRLQWGQRAEMMEVMGMIASILRDRLDDLPEDNDAETERAIADHEASMFEQWEGD